MKASYIIANNIASKPYSDGNFVETCMLKASEIVCPKKQQAFVNISLTRNTVAERLSDLAEVIHLCHFWLQSMRTLTL